MLDRWTLKMVASPLSQVARLLHRFGISPNFVTIAGFCIGMLAIPLLSFQKFLPALACILINRICDGLDGTLARLGKPTDSGGYLDISLDFIFYSGVVFGFALAAPEDNGLAAAALIFAYMGTGCTFLAFAVMAERRKIHSIHYPNKGFYYLGGLAEGTETIGFMILICLFPHLFAPLAWGFACICYLTATIRLLAGYATLRRNE